MWQTIESKVLPALRGAQQLALEHPLECAIYLVPLLFLMLMLARSLWRRQGRAAYWWVAAIVVFNTVFSWGDDTYTHIYRIVALSEEFRHGQFGMLLTNPTTGQVLPVFVFYSTLPYLLPVALNLAGIPVVIAFKLVLGGQFLVLAFGLQVLIDATRPQRMRPSAESVDFLVGILFIVANYVYTLWCTRAALAELWVYSFIPWVVLAIVQPGRGRALTGLLFVQACAHPIVLAQSLLCEMVVPLALSRLSIGELVRRSAGPVVVALVLAVPFWLPQFLWKDYILGPGNLPGEFTESFRTLVELVHARDFRSVGPWMPLALVLLVVAAAGRLDWRFWTVTAIFLVVLFVQWTGVSEIVARVPVLNLSVFVWRLMMPASFLAFGALLAGWRQVDRPPVGALAPIALLAMLAMLWVSLTVAPSYFVKLGNAPNDQHALVNYDRGDGIWGIREFLPNYMGLPAQCAAAAETQDAKYGDLRKGLVAARPYIALPDGPWGFVSYNARLNVCDGRLVLGPVGTGATVRAGESMVDALFYVRMLELLVLALAGLAFRRRARTHGWNR
jgi:hypothetical protein